MGVPYVVGESISSPLYHRRARSKRKRRQPVPRGTKARLEAILNNLNNGVLRGRFQRRWAYGRNSYLDFFFPEIGLGIMIDTNPAGRRPNPEKDQHLRDLGITRIWITHSEIWGSHDRLVEKLRLAWRRARDNHRSRMAAESVIK